MARLIWESDYCPLSLGKRFLVPEKNWFKYFLKSVARWSSGSLMRVNCSERVKQE